jgi:hypothetical protein
LNENENRQKLVLQEQDEDIFPAEEWFLLEDELLEKQLFKAVVRYQNCRVNQINLLDFFYGV